jgi:O-antigen ligase
MWAFWIWRSRRLDTLKYVIPGVAVAIVLFFLMPERVHERISTMVDPSAREQDTSIQGRFDMVIWTGRALAQSPVVGVGVNNYVPWVRRQPGGGTIFNTLHSGYMSILVDQGLLGFLPFLAVILLTWMDYGAAQSLARARRNRGDPAIRELGAYALFLQIALLGCMVGALTHDRSESKGWWMVMGLSATAVTLARRRNAELLAQTPASATDPTGFAVGLPYGSEVASARR